VTVWCGQLGEFCRESYLVGCHENDVAVREGCLWFVGAFQSLFSVRVCSVLLKK
jgi:hypothetical protein